MKEDEGFYDFNFKHFAGGIDKRAYRMPRFVPITIELSYSIRFSFALNNGEPFLGLNAVALHRPNPSITNIISYHLYISAN